MKQATYTRFFATQDEAIDRCAMKNRAARKAENKTDIYCVVDGPEDNYAVVDLGTAIDLGGGYHVAD